MAKKQISVEQIVQAAVSLVSEQGMDALNARSVAARCGCSTQPIYLCFDSLLGLKKAVTAQMQKCYDVYMASELASGKYPEYKASGIQA